MCKLRFNISEIPEEDSRRVVFLGPEDLDLSPYEFEGGEVEIKFYRTLKFIQADCDIKAKVKLVCDRSLESFIQEFSSAYDIIFKTEVEEETEDENGAVRRFDFSSNTFSIDKEVRDSIMLQIPMQIIHPRFLDEDGNITEFETKSFGEASSAEEQSKTMDPRWEELKKLKDKN